jgi:hypothetical protein
MADQGYIGVATDFDSRMQQHYLKTSRGDTHFARAIRLYGWKHLQKNIVFEGSEADCYAFELKLRPKFQIGWNEAIGGYGGDKSQFIDYASRGKPVGNTKPKYGKENPFFGKKHLPETNAVNTRAHAHNLIKTPHGDFYGFNALARYLGMHKATAKKLAIKEGWQIERKPEVY